jgi:hypothetical protein
LPDVYERLGLRESEPALERHLWLAIIVSGLVRNTAHPVLEHEPAPEVGTPKNDRVAAGVDDFGSIHLKVARGWIAGG